MLIVVRVFLQNPRLHPRSSARCVRIGRVDPLFRNLPIYREPRSFVRDSLPPLSNQRSLNRELAWLEFNSRVSRPSRCDTNVQLLNGRNSWPSRVEPTEFVMVEWAVLKLQISAAAAGRRTPAGLKPRQEQIASRRDACRRQCGSGNTKFLARGSANRNSPKKTITRIRR